MGLSLSIILSAWNGVFGLKYFGLKHPVEKIIVRSLSLKSNSFKKKSDESEINEKKMGLERSLSFKSWDSTNEEKDSEVEVSVSAKDLGHDKKTLKLSNMRKPTISLPEPAIFSFSSPRPITELHAAATTVQKVFKSYRTRRNLADCAVVAEEFWWKALDFASLETTSISFYSIEKHETAVSKWTRVKRQVARIGKGLSKDEKAQKLALQHWLEAIDPRHRYGHNLHIYYEIWSDSKSSQPFFYWLDIGDGREINIEKCPRTKLQSQCIQYLGPKERESYEVIVENGKLVYRQSGLLIDTTEDCKWIFVLSTSRSLYIGQKKKGVFQHSSFLSGGATTAAGRLVAHDGILEAIWPYSGHYLPTEDNFKEFISFLEEYNVDLSNVKRCAIDDDEPSSFKIVDEESKLEAAQVINNAINNAMKNADIDEQEIKVEANEAKNEAVAPAREPVFVTSKRLSCKWASGVGPRIGCVRDYPTELQCRALEQVNLSPRINPGEWDRCVPIPSPRPTPKIRISPRLSYMGLPSPRVSVTPAC